MTVRFQVTQDKVPAPGSSVFLMFGNQTISLFNIAGQFYAINDSCPHRGASLCNGRLDGRTIQCPAHGLRFDLASGYLLNSTQFQVTTYPVDVMDGQVFIVMDSGDTHE